MLGLAFSGGKDSLACWHLFRHADPLLIWVNTGKAFPETVQVVDWVRGQGARLLEVKSDQEAQTARLGLPSDIVPIDCTGLGMQVSGRSGIRVQSYLDCCFENISRPLFDAAKAAGVTQLVCGQRDDEAHKAPVAHGELVEGIQRLHPIQHWSRWQVMAYLSAHMEVVPQHFALEHSSMDCYDCTAYLAHSADRAAWTRLRRPELHRRWEEKMVLLRRAVMPAINLLYGEQ